MKHIALFEDFKNNNIGAELISVEDIMDCIKSNGVIYATIVKDFPDNDPKAPLKPVSVDNDGLVTVEQDGVYYEVNLKNVEKIEDSNEADEIEEDKDGYSF